MSNLLDKVQYLYSNPDVTLTQNIPKITVANAEGELQSEFIYNDLL